VRPVDGCRQGGRQREHLMDAVVQPAPVSGILQSACQLFVDTRTPAFELEWGFLEATPFHLPLLDWHDALLEYWIIWS
jgi:hypothetical protein